MSRDEGPELDVKRCAKCAAWIPSVATMCAYCGTSKPDEPPSRRDAPIISLRHGVSVTNLIIGVNLAYLLLALAAEAARPGQQGSPLQWLLTGTYFGRGLYFAGMYDHASVAEGQWWRVATGMFLHAGIIHIGLNMLALRELGRIAEDLFGPAKFLTIYLVCGACSMAATSLWFVGILHHSPEEARVVGASGAIFGIAGLLVVYLLRAGTERGRAIAMSLARSVLFMLVVGFMIPFVSNTGHIGGLIAGALFGLTVRDRFRARIDPVSRARWSRLAAVCVLAAAAALVAGAWFSFSHIRGAL